MADPVARIARRLATHPGPVTSTVGPARWEAADLLARVDAALARRAA